MGLKFTSKEKRDELAERLATLAIVMRRAWDQGSDGKILATEDIIVDIQTAACVVALADIQSPSPS
jgi:hypothetical protein